MFITGDTIKDKYSKRFGKQFRYKNIPQTKETAFESLKFQLNFSNHTVELSCSSLGETQLLTYVINKPKNRCEIPIESIKEYYILSEWILAI
jgi:hypothetical protein